MEITLRSLWTMVHGMGFGALYLLAFSGAFVELYRFTSADSAALAPRQQQRQDRFLRIYLLIMVGLAWLTVLIGAYIIYPWYRAVPPPGAELAMYPQRLLLSSPHTAGWHTLGMEWKEHAGWFAPMAITMVAAVYVSYGRDLRNHPQLRAAVLGFALASFVAAGLAGFFGAAINKYAPVQGGPTIHLGR